MFLNSLGPVKLHVLVLASHAAQRDRYLSILKQTMQKYDEWYGPYPTADHIDRSRTELCGRRHGLSHPHYRWHRLARALVVSASAWKSRWPTNSAISIGMAWSPAMSLKNPGSTKASTATVKAKLLGRFSANTSVLNGHVSYTSDTEVQRLFYIAHPDEDPIVRPGWKFATTGSYGSIVYGKTATALAQLEAVLGEPTLRQARACLLHALPFSASHRH